MQFCAQKQILMENALESGGSRGASGYLSHSGAKDVYRGPTRLVSCRVLKYSQGNRQGILKGEVSLYH